MTTTLASSGTYLPFGPMTGLTYGNTKVLAAAFDKDYNPTSRGVAGIYSSAYSVDANSNITGIGTGTYGYDALNRLNAENIGTATSYTYDLTDNRLTKVTGSTTSTTVPAASNKISAVGASSYTYDLAGNITGDGTNTYTWNAAGSLETVKVGATTVGTYTYDYLGRRAKKVAGATTTYYAYGPNGLLYGEYSSTGTLVKEYVYLDSQPLAQIATGSPEVLTYLHTDNLGTPRYATNTAGTQVWAWPTDAFGISAPTGTVTMNLRFPGQYYDSESGLFYNWNRYYNPNIGRYISPDPIGQEGGLNLFSYVGQSPIMGSDPMGLASSTPIPGMPGLPIFIPPIAIPGSVENQAWVKWAQSNIVQPIANMCSDNTDDPDDCDKLYQAIGRQIDIVKRRYYQLSADKLDLFNTRPTGTNSWQGHQQQYAEAQQRLRNLLNQAMVQGCQNYQYDSWFWATRSGPSQPRAK